MTFQGEIVTCSTLPNPENGQVLLSGTNVGDTATYSCLVGFNIVGVDVRYCRSDGTWTGNEPRCRRMKHLYLCQLINIVFQP